MTKQQCADLVKSMINEHPWNKQPWARLALACASRAIIRGRLLTDVEKLENLRKMLDEMAADLIETFGWPTHVDPVPVALTRMASEPAEPHPDVAPRAKSYARHAALACMSPSFRVFMGAHDKDNCATLLRERCHAKSRSEFIAGSRQGAAYLALVEEYKGWLAADRAGVTK